MQPHTRQRTNGTLNDALDRKPKVRWTEEEERSIAEALARQITTKPYRRTFNKAIKLVQDQLVQQGKLDKNRRREIQGPTNITGILDQTTAILKSRRDDAKQVAWARAQLKQQHHKQLSKEDVLDALTDEEVEVYFQERILQNISPTELLKHFTPQDLLANLPTAAILSAATYRLAEQMERQTSAMTQVAAKMAPGETKTQKPLVQIAGINQKRIDEIRPTISDLCNVERVDIAHLGSTSIREEAAWIVLWTNQLRIREREIIRKLALRKNIAVSQLVETSGSLENILGVERPAQKTGTGS